MDKSNDTGNLGCGVVLANGIFLFALVYTTMALFKGNSDVILARFFVLVVPTGIVAFLLFFHRKYEEGKKKKSLEKILKKIRITQGYTESFMGRTYIEGISKHTQNLIIDGYIHIAIPMIQKELNCSDSSTYKVLTKSRELLSKNNILAEEKFEYEYPIKEEFVKFIELFSKKLYKNNNYHFRTILRWMTTNENNLAIPFCMIFRDSTKYETIISEIKRWYKHCICSGTKTDLSRDQKQLLKSMNSFATEFSLFENILSQHGAQICDELQISDYYDNVENKISFLSILCLIDRQFKIYTEELNARVDKYYMEFLEEERLIDGFNKQVSVENIITWGIKNRALIKKWDTDLIYSIKGLLGLKKLISDSNEDDMEEKIKTKFYEYELMTGEPIHSEKTTISKIDDLSGVEFEELVGKFFENEGYSVEYTPASGDQGADLILEDGVETIVVQLKRYSGNVGNSAIQEAVAAMPFYNADSCMVITNSYFTRGAIELAEANNVVLRDRDWVEENLYLL